MRKSYSLIDIFKFLFSICIIALHTHFLDAFGSTISWYGTHLIFRLAVPFFFVTAGFFYGRKVINQEENIKEITKKYLKRLSFLFIFWLIIGLIPEYINRYDGSVLRTFLSLLQSAVFSPWGALWYLLALIVAVSILYYYLTKNSFHLRKIFLISSSLYLFALISNSYYFLTKPFPFIRTLLGYYLKIFLTSRNGIFVGLLFVTIGLLLAKNEKENFFLSKKQALIRLIFFFLIFFCEVYLVRRHSYLDDHSLFFSLPFLIYYFVMLLLLCSKNKAYGLLRGASIGLYVVHRPILSLMNLFFSLEERGSIVTFITVLTLALLLVFILLKQKNPKIRKIIS